ncbi:HAD-IA family hydrolase [Aquihabitans sp. McL0605]|uniref:HAD-IA family hydrolase n=1 Tax=Aquihabitans sp. McL0605 TaxID=3415671 RepID=UPI003CE6C593
MTIAAVLFDFGGVITTSPFEAFARYERDHALPTDFLRTVNATDPDTNAWARLERSEIDLGGFDAAFAIESERLGHRVDGRDVLALLSGDLRPEMVTAVERCGQRLKTGLLTNNVVGMDPSGAIAEVLTHFDAVIESSVVGVRKPDPAFYELACEALAIAPDQAVFLDDLGVNLKPAKAMGMATIKVGDAAAALDQLEALVGFPLR